MLISEEFKVFISSKLNYGISDLRDKIYNELIANRIHHSIYVANKRHYDALDGAKSDVCAGIDIIARLITANSEQNMKVQSILMILVK